MTIYFAPLCFVLLSVQCALGFVPVSVKSSRSIGRLKESDFDSSMIAADDDDLLMAQQLRSDFDELKTLRPPVAAADLTVPKAIVSAGSSYTRLWTHDTWLEHSNPPHVRYLRHFKRWPWSTTARKILPATLCAGLYAFLVTTFFGGAGGSNLPSSALQVLTAPLALLLTLRANASMSRLVEARTFWGRLVLNGRSLASLIKLHIYPISPRAAELAVRHLATVGWLLKDNLRRSALEDELQVLRTMLGTGDDYVWLTQQAKRSVASLSRIRQICATALQSSTTTTASATARVLEERIFTLESCVGGCERLFSSPIPPTYSRHLSRVLVLWLALLPMTIPSSRAVVVGTTSLAAYVFVGLDEVGMEIENAFNMMPLQQLAGALQQNVLNQFLPPGGDMPKVIL